MEDYEDNDVSCDMDYDVDNGQKTTTFFMVSIFHVDKSYGGPEEGGWWYTSGTPILHPIEELGEMGIPKAFLTENEAVEYCARVNIALNDGPNRGLPSISSVLSRGRFMARVSDGFPTSFPLNRPHYE